MKDYKSYAKSFLVDRKIYSIVEENVSRKKLRRISRKKYSKQYSIDKSYIIVSGDSIKEAIKLYTIQIANKTNSKEKTEGKKTTKQKVAKKKKTIMKSKDSMLEDYKQEEEKGLKRINRKQGIKISVPEKLFAR